MTAPIFFAVSAQTMRRILVDFARSRQYQKRGGKTRHVNLEQAVVMLPKRDADLLTLDDALSRLASMDARKSKVVEPRFFGGLQITPTTIIRTKNNRVLFPI